MADRLLPKPVDLGHFYQWPISHLYARRGEFHGEGERLLSFVLPPFQRPHVWTAAQSIRFIESAILRIPLGTWCYHQAFKSPRADGWVIDGQQRVRAFAQYWADAWPVFGYRWSQLTRGDQNRFGHHEFGAYVLEDESEDVLLAHYLRMNYGGTPHTAADERKARRTQLKPPRKS